MPIAVRAQQVERTTLGQLRDSQLSEVSGMVASRKHPNHFWTHNDSGDGARFFLIDEDAKRIGTYSLEGVEAIDMEDIAALTVKGKHFLLLADIGDNRAIRERIFLYLIEEPDFKKEGQIDTIASENIRILSMTYADKPRDAEAIFVDPEDLTCYLISKRDFHVGVYPIALDIYQRSVHAIVLKEAMNLPLTFVTAADISVDGRFILLKNLTHVYRWERQKNKTVLETLKGKGTKLPYQSEPQGEAICFGLDNHYFYTLSERPLGLDAYLYRYRIF